MVDESGAAIAVGKKVLGQAELDSDATIAGTITLFLY